MMQLRETRAFVFCGVFHAIAAAPWLIAALLSPHLLLLWGFGALVGALWLTLVGTTLETGLATALTAAVGGTLGDAAPWALLLLLVPLCLLESHLLLFLAHTQRREARSVAVWPDTEPQSELPLCPKSMLKAVAEAVHDQGYPNVTWGDVETVHRAVRRGEKPTDPVEQVIAWTLWYQLHGASDEEPD
jgi:hypothetical protein